ncbi:hypothetical protein T4A_5075, partial [Trichinella pseudospiralis]
LRRVLTNKKKTECTKNRFLTLHYANNDRRKGALLSVTVHFIIQNGAYSYGKVNEAKKNLKM